jgi:cobalt-zinc-cadmium efflux system protein
MSDTSSTNKQFATECGQKHAHSHHHHVRRSNRNALALTLIPVVGYMLLEVVGGIWTHSLALLADAGHMLSDVAALGLSLFALWIAERPPTSRRTYGYYRTEILAALANGTTLVAVSVFIFIEAYHRIREPAVVKSEPMLLIAVGGLVVNLIAMRLLHHGRGDSLNLRGAWLHIVWDAVGTVGTIVASILILTLGWNWTDPLASALIGVLVIYSSTQLLAESVSVLMENAPGRIDVDEVRAAIRGEAGVLDVHDLHVWTITSGLDSLSAHVVIEEGPPPTVLLMQLRAMLYHRFGIEHVTVQIEPADFEERAGGVCHY